MLLQSKFEVRRLTLDNFNEATQLITEHYGSEIQNNLWGKINKIDELFAVRVRKKLQQPYSLGVFEKSSNKLIGTMLCDVFKKNMLPLSENSEFQNWPIKLREIAKFMETLEEHAYVYLGTKKIFRVEMMAVHLHYRKLGISSLLLEMATSLACEANCRHVIVIPTNDFLCFSLKRKGWSLIKESKFNEQVSSNGDKLFPNARPPYTKAQVVFKIAQK